MPLTVGIDDNLPIDAMSKVGRNESARLRATGKFSTAVRLGGLITVCLACAFVMSDEPPPEREAPPQAKKADAKRDDEKKNDEKKEPKAPAGYEDAPEAGKRPPARDAEAVVVDFDNIAAALAPNVNAQVANFEKQFAPQFKLLMQAELSFINRACNLDLKQRKEIDAASERCRNAALRRFAIAHGGMMNGFAVRGRQTVPDPNALVHQALTEVLEETLQSEQQAAYDAEMAKREAYRRRVGVENIVAAIDERLVLTIDQRQELTKSLVENWQPNWVQSWETLMTNNQTLPDIPDKFVVSILNEPQKQVWRAARKHNDVVWHGINWAQQANVVLDDFPLVEANAVVE